MKYPPGYRGPTLPSAPVRGGVRRGADIGPRIKTGLGVTSGPKPSSVPRIKTGLGAISGPKPSPIPRVKTGLGAIGGPKPSSVPRIKTGLGAIGGPKPSVRGPQIIRTTTNMKSSPMGKKR